MVLECSFVSGGDLAKKIIFENERAAWPHPRSTSERGTGPRGHDGLEATAGHGKPSGSGGRRPAGRPRQTKALFRYTPKPKILQDFSSHRILRHMHETLSIYKNNN